MAFEVRYSRVPVQWVLDDTQTDDLEERLFLPRRLDPRPTGEVEFIDGSTARNRFLRMEWDDQSKVIAFLNHVGIWDFIPQPSILWTKELVGKSLLFDGVYGGRILEGMAIGVCINQLRALQKMWLDLLRDPGALRDRFGKPKPVRSQEAWNFEPPLRWRHDREHLNTLPARFEWSNGRPIAVLEAVTGWEIMVAHTHADLLAGAKFQICKRRDCAIPFPVTTNHKRKYCEWGCAHLESVRKARREEKKQHGKKR